MNYVQHVNARIKAAVLAAEQVVCFGQNIAAGSCLSGLTRGLPRDARHLVLNTPNSENTLVGVGFGLMLRGVSGIYFMKQQDFLLLGVDHLANTYNFVRLQAPRASFTIVAIAVDSGYQGMQSSLDNVFDFCSIGRVSGYTITNRHDADAIIGERLVAPGFRILSVSQRLFGQELLQVEGEVRAHGDASVLRYRSGEDVTIACFNFAFPQALALCRTLEARGLAASLFSVGACLPCDWRAIIADAARTGRLVIVDDSKSSNVPYTDLAWRVKDERPSCRVAICRRRLTDQMLYPNADEFLVAAEEVLKAVGLS